jgi:hypothetical protein
MGTARVQVGVVIAYRLRPSERPTNAERLWHGRVEAVHPPVCWVRLSVPGYEGEDELIITEEQHVWLVGVAGIHIVTISIAGTDASGSGQDVAKATITEKTADVIQWDSLTSTQV